MTSEERQAFWHKVETGESPLISVLHGLVERWGLPSVILALSDISDVLSEDAVDAKNLTPNQRGLIIGACAQVSSLGEHMRHELDFITSKGNG